MHFGVVVTRCAEYIDNLPDRIFHGVGPIVDFDQYFLTVLGPVQIPQRNEHIVWKFAVIDIDECVVVR